MFGLTKVDYERKLTRMQQEYGDDLREARAEMRREHAAEVLELKDEISTLETKIGILKKLDYKAQELDNRERLLNRRGHEINNDTEILEQEQDHFKEKKAAHEADMEYHHTQINRLQKDAEEERKAAREELKGAKTANFEAGKAVGYAEGLKAGYAASTELVKGQRDSYAQIINMSMLAGTMKPGSATDDFKQAYQDLAKGMSDNIGAAIKQSVEANKTIIVKD